MPSGGALIEELGIGEGERVATMVRLSEEVSVPRTDDPFAARCVEQVRVIVLAEVDGVVGQVHQLWRERTGENGERYRTAVRL